MKINFYKNIKVMLLVLVATFLANATFAQALSGVKTIDPAGSGANNYVSFSSAIDSLNKYGVGTGGVTYNVAAGATFAETNALVLKATGTAAKPIVFQKSGAGANPIVNPAFGSIATSTSSSYGVSGDAILRIVGTDFLTIDGINFVEPLGRSSVALTEYGIAILRASATDGSKNINIKNCTISLNRTTNLSVGIMVINRSETFGSITVTSAVGRNENIVIQNNNINNVYEGVYLSGQSIFTTPYDLYDHFITVRDNSVTNYGGGVNTTYGVYGIYLDSVSVSKNIFTGGLGQTGTYYGIFLSSGTGSTVNIDSNNVALSGWAGNTGTYLGIGNSMGSALLGLSNVVNIRNNKVSLASTTFTTGSATGITNSAGAFTVNMTNNLVSNFSIGATTSTTTGTGTISGITSGGFNANAGSVCNITGNIVRDITRIQQTAATGGTFNGITATSSALTLNVTNNTIRNLTIPTGTGIVNIINVSASADLRNVRNNSIDSVFTGGGTMSGINITGGTTTNVNNNLISGIYANKVAGNTVTGLNITGGTTVNAFNNIINNLRAPISTSNTAVTGISATGGTTVNVDFNTVYLDATSTGSGFGSTALNFGTSPTTLIARNNILYNASTSSGTGRTVAIRRSAANPTNYNNASNNNLIYAGAPGANNLIYLAGITADTTLNQFKARVASADALSLSGALSFVNTSTLPFDLHINAATATLIESAGMTVAGITTDYDGNTRDANNPDMGADEGAFIAGADLQGPAISYTTLPGTGFLTNRTIAVNISDRTGVNTTSGTSPRLYFRKKENINNTYNDNTSATNGWKYVETTSTTSPFSFTIDYSKLSVAPISGDTIQYFVVAQDAATIPNFSINSGILTNPT
ncbi:MAG: beta strand repeat-containing protein, partial [Sediminibacterium sp.]